MSKVIVDTSRSTVALLQGVVISAVKLNDTFWEPRRATNRQVTIPSQHQKCEDTHRLDNFRRASGKKPGDFAGLLYNDSDVYKWVEAASWSLAGTPDEKLAATVDAVITDMAAAQQVDGYLNTYFMFERAKDRFSNLRDNHELYCAGHLIQAAVAHYRATGKDSFLSVARKLGDHICSIFGPIDQGKKPGAPGHEEVEMALVELARATGESKYAKQAAYFVKARGQGLAGGSNYHQDHKPFAQLDEMAGHAVRAVYLTCGATDVYTEAGDKTLLSALEKQWHNMIERRMYVSGGIGSRWEGESFGKDYELPNERAYTETCAAIGSVMWNWRMLQLNGDAKYADLIEWTLYNAVLPGLSLDGQQYFYQNPLADDGQHRRQAWFGTACCPPNLARLLAQLPGYFYGLSKDGVWVHLYGQNHATLQLLDGSSIQLTQRTNYPWDGKVEIEVNGNATFAMHLRIPAWCEAGAKLEINGKPAAIALTPGSYAVVKREWTSGDVVRLTLPMPVRLIECHPYVADNTNRIAVSRGPILYCIEGADHQGTNLADVVMPCDAKWTLEQRPDLLGGVTTLKARGHVRALDAQWSGRLYRTAAKAASGWTAEVDVTAIPYYAWANRQAGAMRVWLPVEGG